MLSRAAKRSSLAAVHELQAEGETSELGNELLNSQKPRNRNTISLRSASASKSSLLVDGPHAAGDSPLDQKS